MTCRFGYRWGRAVRVVKRVNKDIPDIARCSVAEAPFVEKAKLQTGQRTCYGKLSSSGWIMSICFYLNFLQTKVPKLWALEEAFAKEGSKKSFLTKKIWHSRSVYSCVAARSVSSLSIATVILHCTWLQQPLTASSPNALSAMKSSSLRSFVPVQRSNALNLKLTNMFTVGIVGKAWSVCVSSERTLPSLHSSWVRRKKSYQIQHTHRCARSRKRWSSFVTVTLDLRYCFR